MPRRPRHARHDGAFNPDATGDDPAAAGDEEASAAVDDRFDRPSKSQRKRDMIALQDLGAALVEVRRDKLATLELPDILRTAIHEAQRITSHEGKRRQMQYIGKLMRNVETGPIEAALAAWRGESGAEAARLHLLEDWRNRLLAADAGGAALAALCRAHPAALNPDTLQTLRNHIRMARREQAESRPPRHFRELFKLLHEIVEADDGAGPGRARDVGRDDDADHAGYADGPDGPDDGRGATQENLR